LSKASFETHQVQVLVSYRTIDFSEQYQELLKTAELCTGWIQIHPVCFLCTIPFCKAGRVVPATFENQKGSNAFGTKLLRISYAN
jgi:hypothetical protein